MPTPSNPQPSSSTPTPPSADKVLADRIKAAQVPPRFACAEFSKCNPHPQATPEQLERFKKLKAFLDRWSTERPSGFVLVHGPAGSGKSYLSGCAIRRFFEAYPQAQAKYTTYDLVDQIRDSLAGDKAAKFVNTLADLRGLLVIDDLGVGKLDGWPAEQICRIIYRRYDTFMPTLITSNHDLGWIAKNLDTRVADRIAESNNVFFYDGPSRRIAH